MLLFIWGIAGCGDRLHPVHGSVTLEDGKPLAKGLILLERSEGGAPITARGTVKADGSFELSTHKMGDGAYPGKYRVSINPQDMSDVPDEKKVLPFDHKYLNAGTSELEFEVKPGVNEFPIKLTGGKKSRAK